MGMRHFALLAVLLALPAVAGERYLGTIVAAGADTTNGTTAAPFVIPRKALITIQCDATAHISTDTTTAVTTATGVKLSTDVAWPTSVDGTGAFITVSSQQSAIVRVIGTANCKVFERRGNE